MTPDRNEVAWTKYTYLNDPFDEFLASILSDEDKSADFCDQMGKRQCVSQESGMNFTPNSRILGKANCIIVVVDQGSNLAANLICFSMVCI